MTAMGALNATLDLIPQYTGLSVGTFFTLVALLSGLYYLISGLFAPPAFKYVPMEPLPPPRQLGEITADELRAYDGTDTSKPLLMAIKGHIYDVSQSKLVQSLSFWLSSSHSIVLCFLSIVDHYSWGVILEVSSFELMQWPACAFFRWQCIRLQTEKMR